MSKESKDKKKSFRLEDGTKVTADIEICRAYTTHLRNDYNRNEREREHTSYSLDDENAPEAVAENDTENEVERQQEVRKLRQAIRQLTLREQGFIIDYFFNEFSLRELEQKYVTSHTKIRSEIAEALSKLRQYITTKKE